MKRFGLATLVFAAGAAFSVALTPAVASDKPDPKACARAYVIADDFRESVRSMEAKPDSTAQYRGLSLYVDGFSTIDFDARAEALAKRFPDKIESVFALQLESAKIGHETLMLESAGGTLGALLGSNPFAQQRSVLALARSCDLAYDFKPVLGEAPTPERTLALLREKRDREIKSNETRLAALDDTECAVRFALMSNMFPPGSPGQQNMMQRLQVAGSKAMAARGLPEERMMTLIREGVTERAEKFKSGKSDGATLIQEVNACETRLGMPLSELKQNTGG